MDENKKEIAIGELKKLILSGTIDDKGIQMVRHTIGFLNHNSYAMYSIPQD